MSNTETTAQTVKLFLVEDDDDHANLISRGFRRAQVATDLRRFSDASEAIEYFESIESSEEEIAKSSLPRAILLDLNLPRINGIALLKFIRSCKSQAIRNLSVIILTTSDAPGDIRDAYSAGANSYLKKPVNFQEFKSMIDMFSVYWGTLNRPVAS